MAEDALEPPARSGVILVTESADSKTETTDPVRDDLRDLSGLASTAGFFPNLSISSAGSSSFGSVVGLRGLSNTPYFSDAALALYVDNIPLAGGFTYPRELYGFGNTVLLSGPHPTDTGRQGDAGTIIIEAPAAATGGDLSVGVGTLDEHSTGISAGAVWGRFDFGITGRFEERGGTVENTQLGIPVDPVRGLETFDRANFRLTRTLRVTAELLYDRHRDGAAPLVPLGGSYRTVQRGEEGETDTDLVGASILISEEVGAGTLTINTSATQWRLSPYSDWLVLPPALKSVLYAHQTAWNEELRYTFQISPGLTAFAGGWLSEGPISGSAVRSIGGIIPIEDSSYSYERREAAFFAGFGATLPGGWHADAGIRPQIVGKDYHQEETVPIAGRDFVFERRDRAILPDLTLKHAIGSTASLDVSASEGTRPGGYSAYTDKAPLIPFAPERVSALEIGLRWSPASNFELALRAFADAITNLQIERSFSATDYLVADATRARSLGTEATIQWRPVHFFDVEASVGTTDAQILSFTNPLTQLPQAAARAPFSPTYTAALSALATMRSGVFAQAIFRATGRTFYTENEDPAWAQAPYDLWNLEMGYSRGPYRLWLYVANATNRSYYTSIVPGVGSGSPGPPRSVGAELRYHF